MKIFLGRHGAVYELSGRVDLDELDDGDLELPMKLVWEHFSAYLEIFLDTLEELPTIPYQVIFWIFLYACLLMLTILWSNDF